jgi:hypothetical protein
VRRLLAYGLTLVVVVGLAGGSWLGYQQLRVSANNLQAQITSKLVHAQQQLEAGKTSLQQANTKRDAGLAAQAAAQFEASGLEFKDAGTLADRSQLLKYLELTPSVGEQVHSKHLAVDLVSDLGVQLSGAGLELANLDSQLIRPTSAGSAGRTFLTVISQTSASLNSVRAYLIQAQSDASRVDIDLLPKAQQGTLVKARQSIDSGIQALNEFARLAPVLVEILGGNGARTYLVEQVNPAELRAGGGFIGSYSLIRADHGTITVLKSGNAYDLANPRPLPGHPGFIPQPTPYREVIPNISWSFVDSNVYPDFPSNAKAALQFVEPRIGKVDGVIAFDYYTVAKMLALTGPIALPGYGFSVNSSNFVPELIRLDVVDNLAHKTLLAALAGPLMARVSTLPADQWPALIADMNTMASERHMQAYFTNSGVQAEMDRVGWSGTLNPTNASEYFMEVEDNYYGDKDNYFISRHYVITLTRDGNVLHQTVEVDLLNRTPAKITARVEYKAVVRLLVHGGMSTPSDNLRRPIYADPAPPSGFGMIDGWIYVQCCGSRGSAVLNFNSPWAPDGTARESIYWQKQQGTAGDTVTVIWDDGAGHKFTTNGDLTADRVINLSPTAVTLTAGQPGQAVLPTLSLG